MNNLEAKKQKTMQQKSTKGSGLLFSTILMFVVLALVITLSSITVLETKMNQKSKSSVGAFYNSESGVEWALNKIANRTGSTIADVFTGTSTPDATGKIACPTTFGCEVYLLDEAGKVIIADNTIDTVKAVRSVGTQSKGEITQRTIEAAVAANNCPTGLGFTDTGYGYCITKQNSDRTWFDASQYCAIQYSARLCSMSEWLNACVNDKGDFVNQASFETAANPGGRQEIISDITESGSVSAFTPKNCKISPPSNETAPFNQSFPFHCCRNITP